MKKLFGVLAIVLLAMVFAAPQAEAKRCWWNGYTWICKKKPRPYARYYYAPRPYVYAPAHRYYRPYYRPYAYACVWPYC